MERWICPKCDEENKNVRSQCNGCNAFRPAAAVGENDSENANETTSCIEPECNRALGQAEAQSTGSQELVATSQHWTCPHCGESNKASRSSCNSCSQPRKMEQSEENQNVNNDNIGSAEKSGTHLDGKAMDTTFQEEAARTVQHWTCPYCDEANKLDRSSCNSCSRPRPAPAAKEATKPGSCQTSKAQLPEFWTCPKCDESNKIDRDTCNTCKYPQSRLKGVIAESTFMQGRREQQEDRHVKIPDLTKAAHALKMPIDHLSQPCAFFAVYDGHQGFLCAEFMAKAFHARLLQRLSSDRQSDAWTDDRLCSTMREVAMELDDEFLAKHRTAPDGCTAVVSLLIGSRLVVAWLGDSRGLLCRTNSSGQLEAVPVTQDHRPSLPAEAERVKHAGGIVVNFDGAKRVAHPGFEAKIRELRRARAGGLGTVGKRPVALAVSRAFGDRHFKAVTGKPLLIASPSVQCFRLNRSVRFFTLMCDGITDVMKNDEIIFELNFSKNALDLAASARTACGELVKKAYKRGSGDNLTVVLVQLEWEGGYFPLVSDARQVGPAVKVRDAPAAKRLRTASSAAPQGLSAKSSTPSETSEKTHYL